MDKTTLKETLKEFYKKAWQDHLCGMFRRDERVEEYVERILNPDVVGNPINTEVPDNL